MDKLEKIKLLVKFSGAESTTLQSFRAKVEGMGFLDEATKAKVISNFEKGYAKYSSKQVEVYAKWLSEAAVDAAIAFYQSPEGQEVRNNLPHITQELVVLSTELMSGIFNDIIPVGDEDDQFGSGSDFDLGFGRN